MNDFTFGGNIGAVAIQNVMTNNAFLMATLDKESVARSINNTLGDVSARYNPRQNVYFSAKHVSNPNSPGVGPDGILRDPWGTPYIVTVDINDDNMSNDSFYSALPGGGPIRGSVTVWSAGPDRKVNPTVAANEAENKDNVVSWK